MDHGTNHTSPHDSQHASQHASPHSDRRRPDRAAHDPAPHDRAAPVPAEHDESGHATSGHDQAELLDLEAEVLAEHLSDVTAWLPLGDLAPRHVVDLGCGTGAGTFALLDRFPQAEVTAVDASAAHLDRLREKVEAAGAGGRVRTVRADLDAGWPDLGAPELVWASASMHHMADPDRALREVHGLLAPGGLLAMVELAGHPRFLPADAPRERPGLEERCHAAGERFHAEHVPHRGADWGPKLAAAGFAVAATRTVTVHLDRSRGAAVGRYALQSLRRLRAAAAPSLDPADLAALDRLLDTGGPQSITDRDDLAVRTERSVWAARRAG